MASIDWIILCATLIFIVVYGIWKTRKSSGMENYILGGKEAKWATVGLSVMATQASAITFLSTPGQAYHDGMGFVQFYFGLPIAMVIICITFIPIYHKLKVYTAYEFLESRFDLKTRTLAAILFLVQRGLAAGITIYAPAIILSTIIGWNLYTLIVVIGILVIIYTVSGGTKAVNVTQKQQMGVIMLGMFVAFYLILSYLPDGVGFIDSLKIAGASDKMDVLDFSVDLNSRYTFWSGITGGLFLMLSYFGTDQSQVQRYLSAKSIKESRMGLIMNGLLKVPMQFFILLVGVLVFVFYQFNKAPVFFNPVGQEIYETSSADAYRTVEDEYDLLYLEKQKIYTSVAEQGLTPELTTAIGKINSEEKVIRNKAKDLIKTALPSVETNDKDYVFITFILNHLPKGLIGLLLAMIFSAAMSSTASELNALGTTTSVDLYKRSIAPGRSEKHYVFMSKMLTLMWGLIAIGFACYGTLFENLIQFVNIIGSIFYGTILGIFLVGFYLKWIKGNAIFYAAIVSQIIVIVVYKADVVSYLMLNFIGCALVTLLASMIQVISKQKSKLT
ncbi:MAG: sodium:solute symporter [Saprospiraceae bacterium]|nr:sodium:solute symporter [Saprospiraceae bacterium]